MILTLSVLHTWSVQKFKGGPPAFVSPRYARLDMGFILNDVMIMGKFNLDKYPV